MVFCALLCYGMLFHALLCYAMLCVVRCSWGFIAHLEARVKSHVGCEAMDIGPMCAEWLHSNEFAEQRETPDFHFWLRMQLLTEFTRMPNQPAGLTTYFPYDYQGCRIEAFHGLVG